MALKEFFERLIPEFLKPAPAGRDGYYAKICMDHQKYLANPIKHAKLRANFKYTDLTGVSLPRCSLEKALFNERTVIGAGTNLSRVKFDAQDIADANVRLTGADRANLPESLHALWDMQKEVDIRTSVSSGTPLNVTLKGTQILPPWPIANAATPTQAPATPPAPSDAAKHIRQ